MTADGLTVLKFVFTTCWSLFTSFVVPGTHTTPAEWALFCLVFVLALRIVKNFLGLPSDPGSQSSGSSGKSKDDGPSAHNTPHVGM